jgi:hypothetical protein
MEDISKSHENRSGHVMVFFNLIEYTFPEFASMTTKQWFQVKVELDVFIHLLYFKSNLDFKPALFRGHWSEFGKGILIALS